MFIVTFLTPVKSPANKQMWSFQLETIENIYPLGVRTEEMIQKKDLRERKETKNLSEKKEEEEMG